MKTFSFRILLENKSQFGIDTVWENAQDLEHVPRLHKTTNRTFELLFVHKNPESKFVYDVLMYRAIRKEKLFRVSSFGFRKIISAYNLHQVEYVPILGMSTALNSLLFPIHDPPYKTLMVDEVIIEAPIFLKPLQGFFTRAMKSHATVQCLEDEPFRERRELLVKKGLDFPLSIFGAPDFNRLTNMFQIGLHSTKRELKGLETCATLSY